jgi:DNA-binding transcriptional LysR family regulator
VSLTEAGKTLLEYARKMVRARDDAMRDLGALKTLKTGTLNIAAHESAAVYLLPAPLRNYLTSLSGRQDRHLPSPLAEIPRQVMDREVHVGFVKDEPGFHELQCVEVHADEMILVAAPRHPLAERPNIHVRDLGGERFVVHHLCSSTEQKILRLFEQHQTPCRIAAELWSFENIKSFVQAEVGMAIVPRITVAQELRDRALVQIPVAELDMPRRTLMIYREQGYLSQAARELIKIVRSFNWDSKVLHTSRRRRHRRARAAAGLKSPRSA